jgi:membrane-bound inhibitor of C-type lysozyme
MKKFSLRRAHRDGRRLLAGLSAQAAAVAVAPVSSQVVISQVYGGGGNSGAKYKNDFIELFNRGSTAVTSAAGACNTPARPAPAGR